MNLGNLGCRYRDLGQVDRAIEFHQQCLAIMRELGDRYGEAIALGNLGKCFSDLGQVRRAIELCEQALPIDREVGHRREEADALLNLSRLSVDEARYRHALDQANDAVKIGTETRILDVISRGNESLAMACLSVGDLPTARAAAEAACAVDAPLNNTNAFALLALIALRQGDRASAAESFQLAIAHADVMLNRCDQNYSALDTKGLAMAGLAVLGVSERAVEAIGTFRAAWALTCAPGLVARLLRLINNMTVVDNSGILAEVRLVAAGKDVGVGR
jgi:tetratricopeptide (TPR) repeat protein